VEQPDGTTHDVGAARSRRRSRHADGPHFFEVNVIYTGA
jgi:hypothetical protein